MHLEPNGRSLQMRNRAPASFNQKDAAAKDECRRRLVADCLWHSPPKTIFTLGGINMYDVALFRKTWGDGPRIVSLERQRKTAELALRASRENGCELLVGTVNSYVNARDNLGCFPSIQKLVYDGTENSDFWYVAESHRSYDFPKFDLAFLDYTEYPKRETLDVTARFIREHMTTGAIVGVTFNIRRQIGWNDVTLAMAIQDAAPAVVLHCHTYSVRCPMAFLMFRVS